MLIRHDEKRSKELAFRRSFNGILEIQNPDWKQQKQIRRTISKTAARIGRRSCRNRGCPQRRAALRKPARRLVRKQSR
jgi:hypothetical protein